MDTRRIASTLVNKCRQHNEMIMWFGYNRATRTSYFQDVYSIDKFLNQSGILCILHKDERNQYINTVSINGKRHTVKGKEAVYHYYGGDSYSSDDSSEYDDWPDLRSISG